MFTSRFVRTKILPLLVIVTLIVCYLLIYSQYAGFQLAVALQYNRSAHQQQSTIASSAYRPAVVDQNNRSINHQPPSVDSFWQISPGHERNHSIFYHQYSTVSSCPLVLRGGRFVNYDQWEPHGCTLYNYTNTSARSCMQQKTGSRPHRIVFIGDSRVRFLYHAFGRFFNKRRGRLKFSQKYATDDLQIEFLWRPTINETKLTLQTLSLLPLEKRPMFILAGTAAWCIWKGRATQESLNNYKAELKALQPYTTELQHTTTLIWMIQPRINETLLRKKAKDPDIPKYINNSQIDLYNAAAYEILQTSPFQIWSSVRDVAEGFHEPKQDGIHIPRRANYWGAQLLLNVLCNWHMMGIQATCCKPDKQAHFLKV